MNTNKYSVTSNEVKLFKHLDNLANIQDGYASPVMFHISPTNKCNMKCDHCCFSNRDMKDELEISKLKVALKEIQQVGTKSIEWTGGGEPTIYKHLPEATDYAKELGFAIGMCTNALMFREELDYSKFDWVRVSLNIFDMKQSKDTWFKTVKRIKEQTKVTACYVAGNFTSISKFREVARAAEELKVVTRITPNCIQSQKKIESLVSGLKHYQEEYGNKYTFVSDFNISFEKREDNVCMMHMLKPFLFSDGYVYSCPSSELSPENKQTLQKRFRVCKMEDIEDYYLNTFKIKKHPCSYCKYARQNNILKALITEVEDEKFC